MRLDMGWFGGVVTRESHERARDTCVCMHGRIYSKRSVDHLGKAANPARGQLNRENEYFPVRVRA